MKIAYPHRVTYNVPDLTGNWESCFLKRRGETGLPRKKNLSETHMWRCLRDSRTRATLVGSLAGWGMPSPLHPSIFQRYWIILTCVATISLDPHGNVTTPSPRDNAQESASDWRVKRVHDNCIAIPIPREVLWKEVKLFIRSRYLDK